MSKPITGMLTPMHWSELTTRRERLEQIAGRCELLTEKQAAHAWQTLCRVMAEMSDPGPATPKFNDLLLSIYRAGIRGRFYGDFTQYAKPVQTQSPA